jgi:hypothetical protein
MKAIAPHTVFAAIHRQLRDHNAPTQRNAAHTTQISAQSLT